MCNNNTDLLSFFDLPKTVDLWKLNCPLVTDLKLTEIRKKLQADEEVAEFDQLGQLIVANGKVVIRKLNNILSLKGGVCEEYWKCQKLIFSPIADLDSKNV